MLNRKARINAIIKNTVLFKVFFIIAIWGVLPDAIFAANGKLSKVIAYYVYHGVYQGKTYTANGTLTIDAGTGDQLNFDVFRTTDGTSLWKFWG